MPAKSTTSMESRRLRLLRAAGFRALFLAALWWTLTEGSATSWVIGGPLIMAVVALSVMAGQVTPIELRLSGLLRFLPYFLWNSILGAADVARRVYRPQLVLNPGLVAYRTLLPTEPARVFFANVVSLLPGTLSAELRNDELLVHVLDESRPVTAELANLEQQIALLFGQAVSSNGTPS